MKGLFARTPGAQSPAMRACVPSRKTGVRCCANEVINEVRVVRTESQARGPFCFFLVLRARPPYLYLSVLIAPTIVVASTPVIITIIAASVVSTVTIITPTAASIAATSTLSTRVPVPVFEAAKHLGCPMLASSVVELDLVLDLAALL